MKSLPLAQPDDSVQKFIRGDRAAFDELYKRHARELLAFLVARLKNLTDAEDVLQEVWVKVWKGRDTYQQGNFRGWVFQIARTTLVDDRRRRERRSEVDNLENGNEPEIHVDAVSVVERQQELAAFRECLNEVGSSFVQAFRMVKVEQMTPVAAAEQLKIKRATVDSRVFKGRREVADCVEAKLK